MPREEGENQGENVDLKQKARQGSRCRHKATLWMDYAWAMTPMRPEFMSSCQPAQTAEIRKIRSEPKRRRKNDTSPPNMMRAPKIQDTQGRAKIHTPQGIARAYLAWHQLPGSREFYGKNSLLSRRAVLQSCRYCRAAVPILFCFLEGWAFRIPMFIERC